MATLMTLVSFNGGDGTGPVAGLTSDAAGDLFGTTTSGGPGGGGTVFEVAKTPSGYATTPLTLASFNGSNGSDPQGGLAIDAAGNLFGTTYGGGADGYGTVFEVAKTAGGYASTPTTLVTFNGSNGANPVAALTLDASGNLFGTTLRGGPSNLGTLFEVTPAGGSYASTPSTLVSFDGSNGSNPYGGLTLDGSGDVFGTTSAGGQITPPTNGSATGFGTVFELPKTSGGYAANASTLHVFLQSDGSFPSGELFIDAGGNLFGTAANGGPYNAGTVFELSPVSYGVSFLYGFRSYGPSAPFGGVIGDAQGNLFGTSERDVSPYGGAIGNGTVFEIPRTNSGAPYDLALVEFDGTNGRVPYSPLLVDAEGNLFGTTGLGGAADDGTVFEVTNSGYVACFCRGTHILTTGGEKAVETLVAGETVVTASGKGRLIRWIGRRSYGGPFLAANQAVQPVRFATGSLGGGLPRRDLLVSPEHAMFLDGVLVPAKLLVNDETIVREADLATVEYFHIELDSHDLVLAEGAPSETFVDCDSRGMFQNAHTFVGDAPRWSFCAPRVEDGPVLARIRDRLCPRAPAPVLAPVLGHLDWATHDGCSGWACRKDDPGATVEVEVLVDGSPMVRVTANTWRPDVAAQGIGTGRYGFRFAFARPLPRFRTHVVTARAVDGGDLLGTVQLDAAAELDRGSLPALAASLQSRAVTPEGAGEMRSFLLDQLQAVRAARSRPGSAPLALVLDDAVPQPDRNAGSAAVTSHMRALQRLGYRVMFVPLDNRPATLPEGVGCAAWPEFSSVEYALRQHRGASLVYVHRVTGMALYGALIRRACPGARLVYSVADLRFLRLGRQAAVERSLARMAESHRAREQELAAARLADMTLTHSTAEADLLRRLLPGVSTGVVPWHVPLTRPPNAWRGRSGLLFVGDLRHAPDADALRWLASEIMPQVATLDPRVRCKVIGLGLIDSDRAWLHPAMDVLGPLEELSSVYRSSRVAVAPLRFGAGLNGSVSTAFAAGLPCVMTATAAEGFAMPEALRPLVVADADAFAHRVVALHADPRVNQAAGEAARAFMAATASEQMVDAVLANAIASARSPRRNAASGNQ